MKYRIIQRKNPLNPTASGLYYAIAVNEGKISLRDFSKEIEGRSSLTRGDIENVLENFIDELPTFLKLGYSIQLGDFGTLHLNIQSDGSPTIEGFNAGMINGVKVIFTPGVELKKALDKLHYEVLPFEQAGASTGGAYISHVTDVTTGAIDGKLTPKGQIVISGEKIKIEPDNDATVGVFIAGGGATHRLAPLAVNRSKEIVGIVPDLPDGSYDLYIDTRYSGNALLSSNRRITCPTPIIVDEGYEKK